MSHTNVDRLRERYFELSKLCTAAIAGGADKAELEEMKVEMEAIIRSLNEADGRKPSDLILD